MPCDELNAPFKEAAANANRGSDYAIGVVPLSCNVAVFEGMLEASL